MESEDFDGDWQHSAVAYCGICKSREPHTIVIWSLNIGEE